MAHLIACPSRMCMERRSSPCFCDEHIVVGQNTVNVENEGPDRLHFIENVDQFYVELIIGPKFGNLVLGQPEVC